MTAREKDYWIAFSCFSQIGPKKFRLLLKYFGSAKKAWEAGEDEWKKINLGQKTIENFLVFRRDFDLSSYFLRLKNLGVNSLILEDKNYPENLKRIDNSPFVLYLLGNLEPKDVLSLGVVGTRKITSYGKEVTEKLVGDLVASGLTIVSGLCYGVDYIAHTTALELGGRTIGVWAGGLDTLNLGFRKYLVEKIIHSKQGAIVSEYSLGFHPLRTTFPQRNRIISGLSLGVLVTEAADDSGSLITAQCATEQGRKVFAVPGPITSSQTAGTAKLLKSKAILVYDVKDVLEELQIEKKIKGFEAKQVLPDNDKEGKILDLLKNENLDIDEIAKITKMEVAKISSLLSMMEIKGLVRNLGGSVYGPIR